MIKLTKDGDKMSITSTEKTEPEFIAKISEALDSLIEEKEFNHDWYFQFLYWIPMIVQICIEYRTCKQRDPAFLHAGPNDPLSSKHLIYLSPEDRKEKP